MSSTNTLKFWRAVFQTGFLVFLLVALGTTLNYMASGGKNPAVLLRFVASGLFGKSAFDKSLGYMPTIGALLHLVVSVTWAFVYIRFKDQIRGLVKNWFLSGLAFGEVIWIVMALVVLPLSLTPPTPVEFPGSLIDIAICMFGAGLPIAFSVHLHAISPSNSK